MEERSCTIASMSSSRSWRSSPRRKPSCAGRSVGPVAMYDFLIAASGFVLAMIAIGLFVVLRGPGNTERMMAAQLVGTGGIAGLLMAASATGATAAADLALTLALLATFASIASARRATPGPPAAPEGTGE